MSTSCWPCAAIAVPGALCHGRGRDGARRAARRHVGLGLGRGHRVRASRSRWPAQWSWCACCRITTSLHTHGGSYRRRMAGGGRRVQPCSRIVLLPALVRRARHRQPSLWTAVGLTALKVSALVAFTVVVGSRVIPYVLDRVALTRSRELFTLDGAGDCAGHCRRFGARVRRVDGAWRVPRRHGRGPVGLQSARGVGCSADARRVRGAVLCIRGHAAGLQRGVRIAVAASQGPWQWCWWQIR